ncbi:MAG: hypothetical protein MHM6MM_003956 [Cercozoa sp. M6MM]
MQRVEVESVVPGEQAHLGVDLSFRGQYGRLFLTRLEELRPAALLSARKRWPNVPVAQTLGKAQHGTGTHIFVGITFKKLQLRRDVLADFDEGFAPLKEVPQDGPLVHDADRLYLEDSSGRIVLSTTGDMGDTNEDGSRQQGLVLGHHVTGEVIAVLGHLGENSVLQVRDWVRPAPLSTAPAPSLGSKNKRLVAFVSGLRLSPNASHGNAVDLLVDYLVGLADEEDEEIGQVCRVIIAGDSVVDSELDPRDLKTRDRLQRRDVVKSLSLLDALLAQLALAVPVDLIPGETDPSNVAMPRPPLHAAFFPLSSQLAGLTRASDPHEISVDGTVLLGTRPGTRLTNYAYSAAGTGGSNLVSMRKACTFEHDIDVLGTLCTSQCISPVAGDMESAAPIDTGSDPFLLRRAPHVMFAGCAKKFAYKRVVHGRGGGDNIYAHAKKGETETLCVCVPDFSQTGQLVLLDLDSWEAHTVAFDLEA